MSYDGSHLICEKHKKETIYCSITMEWVCIKCELEKRFINEVNEIIK